MTPDLLANMHHVFGGALLAGVLTLLLQRRVRGWWLIVGCAVGLTMIAEAVNEVLEWRFLRGDNAPATAYYDLIADLVTTPVGALIGALAVQAGIQVFRATRHRPEL